MPGRSKLSLQKRGKLHQLALASPPDEAAADSTALNAVSPKRVGGKSTGNNQASRPAEDAGSSLNGKASLQQEDAPVSAGGLEVASLMETSTSPASNDVGSGRTAAFECMLCGRKCESSQKKLLHVRQCATSLGLSPAELALLTQDSECLPVSEEEDDFSVAQRKRVEGDRIEGRHPTVARRKRKAKKEEELMPMEEEELRLAIALSASEAPPEALVGKGQSPGRKRRRGQKQLQAPPPLASMSTSQVKRRIEHRIEQVLNVNKPLVSDGLCTQTTPELPQSKLAGRGVRNRGRGRGRGPGPSRTSPLLFGGSEREGSPLQGGGDGEPVVEISSGEDSPPPMDTAPLPHLRTTTASSARQHLPPEGKSLLWSLSAYCEQEESARFYVSCLSEHIPRALQEGEGVGQPILAEVEGVERAWQAEQACVSSVEEGEAEQSGRGPGRQDVGVQTDDGDRIRVEVVSAVRLSADLGCLLGDTVFADTELKLSDGSSVRAHSAVLAARWPQFREAAVRHLSSSLSHQFTLALPHRDPSSVRALLHYLYTGQVKGEDRSKPADLATDMEAFVASTAPLSLHFQPPKVTVGKESDEECWNSPERLGLAAVQKGSAPKPEDAPGEGEAPEGGVAPVPLEVQTPSPDEPPSPCAKAESPPNRGDSTDDTLPVRESNTSGWVPLEAYSEVASLSLDVDIPVSSFELTTHSEEPSCASSPPLEVGGADSTVGGLAALRAEPTALDGVRQGELSGSHVEPMNTGVGCEDVVVDEDAQCCTRLSNGSGERPVVRQLRSPSCGSPTAPDSRPMLSPDCDLATEKLVHSVIVDVTDSSDREDDSDSTESVGENTSDDDDEVNCASYIDLFGGVEEVGGLLQCPQMERLVTPLRNTATFLHPGHTATPVAMATTSLTHSPRQAAFESSHCASPHPVDEVRSSSQLLWSGDSPQVFSDGPSTTPSLPTDPSALSSTETCPTESSRCGQGLFQPPLPPTVPITYTPRAATPNPTPTPTAAGSSQFVSGPITPMPDYMSMATPWLKEQLKKYGVRPLTKKRMIAKLIEIYEYLHPVVDEGGRLVVEPVAEEDRRGKVQGEKAKGKGKGRRVTPCSCQQLREGESDNMEERVYQYIQEAKDLHQDVITYKPLHFPELHQRLKGAGINISKPSLMDYLDKQCITFTLPRSGRTTRS